MHSKVSVDWLSRYIEATPPVLEIFKMPGYFPDSPRTPWRWNFRGVKWKGYSKRTDCEQTESRQLEKTHNREYLWTGETKRTEYCSKEWRWRTVRKQITRAIFRNLAYFWTLEMWAAVYCVTFICHYQVIRHHIKTATSVEYSIGKHKKI